MPEANSRRLLKCLLILYPTLLLILGLFLTWRFIVSSNLNINGVEPNVIYSIAQVLDGKPLYLDIHSAPYAVTQYSPLYYILSIKVAQALKVVPGVRFSEIFVICRLLASFFSLGIAILSFVVCQHYGVNRYQSYVISVIVFIIPIPWFNIARPDSLTAFCGTSAIVFFILYLSYLRINGRRSLLCLFASGVCCYLALMAKQNGIIYALCPSFFLLLMRNLRSLFYFIGGFVIAFIVSSFLFSSYFSVIPSSSNYFFDNIIGGVNNGTDFRGALTYIYYPLITVYLPFAVIPIFCSALIFWSAIKDREHQTDLILVFLAFAFVLILLFNILTGLKIGSRVNYIYPPLQIGLLLSAFYLLKKTEKPLYKFRILFLVTILSFSIINCVNVIRAKRTSISLQQTFQYDETLLAFLSNEIVMHPETYIYSTSNTINMTLFQTVILPMQDITQLLDEQNVVDYSEVGAMLKNGNLRYIVLNNHEEFPAKLQGYSLKSFELLYAGVFQDIYVNTVVPTTHFPKQFWVGAKVWT
jgi:hypothetical protein